MKIKNKYTGEIKDFEYDFMGKAEAKRLLNTGQWEKVKQGTSLGEFGGNTGYGSLSQGFGSFDDDEEDEDDWGY